MARLVSVETRRRGGGTIEVDGYSVAARILIRAPRDVGFGSQRNAGGVCNDEGTNFDQANTH